jgi:hypothetical protein
MIRLTLAAQHRDINDFIEDRLVLLLSERKLRQGKGLLQSVAFKQGAVQNIDDTIVLYRKDDRATDGVIITTQERRNRLRLEAFGFAIRHSVSGDAEVFIDTYREAIKKGILKAPRPTFARITVGAVLIAALLIASIVFLPVFLFTLFIIVFGYPIIHLFRKRQFTRSQMKMQNIMDIFATAFPERSRADSKDWVSFWGRVKSEAPDLFVDFASSL